MLPVGMKVDHWHAVTIPCQSRLPLALLSADTIRQILISGNRIVGRALLLLLFEKVEARRRRKVNDEFKSDTSKFCVIRRRTFKVDSAHSSSD